jgi:nucleoside-diphosphate-sugar epimerase
VQIPTKVEVNAQVWGVVAVHGASRKNRMKILVVGGTGKVGSAVVKELVRRKAEVRVLVRKKDASSKMPENVELAEGDLLDPPLSRRRLTESKNFIS